MSKRWWLSRTAGGVVAGVVMAGAGVGVAVAGTAGSSDQYTPGAKPYAGVQPHNVTVGTQTFPSSVTTTIANTTVTQTTTTAVLTPYVPAATILQLEEAAAALKANATTISALLKSDMRKLLEPSGNYLKTTTLAKAKTISFAFASPGSGKLSVAWKIGVPGKNNNKGVFYVNYSGTLKKLGDIRVNLPTTALGRGLLTGATKGNVIAVVTYTSAAGGSFKVGRNYKLIK